MSDRCPTCHSRYDCDCAAEQAYAVAEYNHRSEERAAVYANRAFAPSRSLPHQTSVRTRWED